MGKIVVISVYKSEALEYLRTNDILKEDALIACSNAEVKASEGKASKIILLSAPMGVPVNMPYLESLLLEKKSGKSTSPAPKASESSKPIKVPDISKAPEVKVLPVKEVPQKDKDLKPTPKQVVKKKVTPKAKK